MQILDIPILKFIEVKKENDKFILQYNDKNKNHLNSIHAASQFALAEAGSATMLQELFPTYKDDVIAVLRESKLKYKKQATGKISSFVDIKEDRLLKFKNQFERKSRATIILEVELKDKEEAITCQASFTWFIQKINSK